METPDRYAGENMLDSLNQYYFEHYARKLMRFAHGAVSVLTLGLPQTTRHLGMLVGQMADRDSLMKRNEIDDDNRRSLMQAEQEDCLELLATGAVISAQVGGVIKLYSSLF